MDILQMLELIHRVTFQGKTLIGNWVTRWILLKQSHIV